ncbi:glycogen synthase (ADP-glucose) [Edaphobacter aggregans]|uniref:Glycogen synthase n=1 Tax=Edaphobacter aggregans TaxID=570835 RepID=A0A3R9R6W9_9BACT|nr:glycogen synthase GlgA [Edaphobacter aggregans]RSL19381.1 glycogen synthase (ADP-glucose) [Edaphobacter aggregans]
MHIVFAASECSPWAKTGGLADVVSGLPRALVKMGHKVSVFLPYYRQVAKAMPDAKVVLQSVTIPFPYYNRFVRILDGGVHWGVQNYFVDSPELFDRESFYGTPSGDYPDNAERFGLFSRAVIEATKIMGVPDVYHVHDWQAAMVAVLMRSTYYFDPVLRHVPAVLTIHNAGYQGWFPPRTIEMLLLPWDMFTFEKLEQDDKFNFLKGGIVYADALTTVSRKYAEEIQTAEYGNGLEGTLAKRSGDLFGILNGVDYEEWNPATDPNIAAHYSAEKLAGKKECRRDLLHAFGVENVSDETAVIGVVSRFATQKGFDFIVDIMDRLVQEDIILLMLGNGEEYYERLLVEMAERYPQKIRVQVKFDNVMAHKIEAGADMFLMPSRYEPGGLNQIYSLKYGTIPIVRATGGLDDTIDEQPNGGGNGFKFWGYDSGALLDAIQRALGVFRNKTEWTTMMKRAMAEDFSWDKPAQEYVRVYERVVHNRS